MRIALDARTIYSPARRGIGKSLLELYRHVAAMRPDWEIVAFHRPYARRRGSVRPRQRDLEMHLFDAPNIRPRCIDMPGDRIDAWERFRLPLAAWQCGADLLHCPANTCPTWMPVPTVVSIYDLIPLEMPEGRPAEAVRRFERCVRRACRRAAWIMCPSAYTAHQLVEKFNADAQRLTISPLAAAPAPSARHPRDQEQDEMILQRLGIRAPFVLHFGAGEKRKNTRRVIEAWAMTDRIVRRGWQLLVIGLDDSDPKAAARFASVAQRLGVASSVRLRGFVPEADLPSILSSASVLAYPSLSEGFGLPILDAWSAGLPVLTSDTTCLPEVAGNAALMVNPTDPCAIARGLQRLMQDGRLRQDLAERGRQRLRTFTWQNAAKCFVEMMENVAAQRRRRAA